jgi:tetratricopeptide (TPR) repeat protein
MNPSPWPEIDKADDDGLAAVCRELCERRLRENPNNVWLLSMYSRQLIAIGLYEEARDVIAKAERLASTSRLHWIVHRRAYLLERMGKYQEAADAYLQAHALEPKEAAHLICAGNTAYQSGDFSQAIGLTFQAATQCNEDLRHEAYLNLGCYQVANRNYEEARRCFLMALELTPDYAQAKVRLKDVEQVLLLRHSESTSLHVLPNSPSVE